MARMAAPDEACGLLFGPKSERMLVSEVVRIANLKAGGAVASFELDPGEWVAAEATGVRRGLERLGFWHSHPSGSLSPSAEDTAAAWEGSLHVIVAPLGEVAAYVLEGGRFRDRRVQPLPQGPP